MTQSTPIWEPWMTDPDAAWWAKIQRARTHASTLGALAAHFRDSEPYSLTREPGNQPDEVAYRLRIHRDVPAEVSTVVGDIVHNLRSALDSLAYGLARKTQQREEAVTGFPWCVNATDFDRFFGIGISADDPCDEAPQRRGSIFSPKARSALRAVQPFAPFEVATTSKAERRRLAEEIYLWSGIRRLQRLSNIDKHRRPTVVGIGLWPELLWWGGNENDDTQFRWTRKPPKNNEILCYLRGSNAANLTLHHEFPLVLTDDPMYKPEYPPQDCHRLLDGFVRGVHAAVGGVLWQYAKELAR